MANTLTNLLPTIYEALDVVSRELVGFIPAVARDSTFARAALNQSIIAHVAPAATLGDITPGATPPADGNQTFGNISMSITKSKYSPVLWNGEESLSLNNANGVGRNRMMLDQFTQSFRLICNTVEADLAGEFINVSRYYGAAATTPFGTNLDEIAAVRKMLDDNGAPPTGRTLVMNTTAAQKMRTLGQLSKVNEAGDNSLLRFGELANIYNIGIRESGQIKRPVSGTSSSSTTDAAGYAVGATLITLASAGTGTLVAGDVITIAGDANKYVLAAGDADTSNGGTFTLNAPGLLQAIPASAKAITVIAQSTRNFAFTQNALVLATRAPARPEEGDMAEDVQFVTDPRSGLVFEISLYRQYKQVKYEVAMAWGWKTTKKEHMVGLLGE